MSGRHWPDCPARRGHPECICLDLSREHGEDDRAGAQACGCLVLAGLVVLGLAVAVLVAVAR